MSMFQIHFPLLMIQTYNFLVRLYWNKEPASNEKPSPDNDEFIALDVISPPNGAGTFNEIVG